MSTTPAARRYIRRFIPTMIAYVGILFAATYAVDAWHPTGPLLWTLSVLPALPIIGAMVVIGLYLVEESDEYLRQRIVTAMLFGIGAVLAASTVLGFLQINGVVGKVDLFWGFPGWCGAWGLAQCWMALRDRTGGSQ
ncbi:MAG: hypothetical protein V4574_09205 [Pseudomonadota bacterium]